MYTCKTKSTRNPLYRWVIGEGSLNEFAFSPCAKYLATVGQDGFLRVFHYDTMELVGRVRSYFGGLLCVSWSPDGKYIVAGGEDDLVTVWSFAEKRVVARGQGHKSWVSVVAFDPFTTSYCENGDVISGSDEDLAQDMQGHCLDDTMASVSSSGFNSCATSLATSGRPLHSSSVQSNGHVTSFIRYRFGSVGQDTQLCLWDLTDDVLKQPVGRSRTSILISSPSTQLAAIATSNASNKASSALSTSGAGNNSLNGDTSHYMYNSVSKAGIVDTRKEHKRNFSLGSRNSDKNSFNRASNSKHNAQLSVEDPVRLLGSPSCPRLDEVPMLEPLICKKISHERLTALVFREDCFVTACQEGYVCTWARPGKWVSNLCFLNETCL